MSSFIEIRVKTSHLLIIYISFISPLIKYGDKCIEYIPDIAHILIYVRVNKIHNSDHRTKHTWLTRVQRMARALHIKATGK